MMQILKLAPKVRSVVLQAAQFSVTFGLHPHPKQPVQQGDGVSSYCSLSHVGISFHSERKKIVIFLIFSKAKTQRTPRDPCCYLSPCYMQPTSKVQITRQKSKYFHLQVGAQFNAGPFLVP